MSLAKSIGRYSYEKPSTVSFEVERDSVMAPYARLSGCVSDVTRGLTDNPILSPSWVDAWSDSTAALEASDSTVFIITRSSNDTVFRDSIDAAQFVVRGISISLSNGSLYYNASFSWGFFNDTIPYLEAVKISAMTEFQRGGVDFFNIFVNGASGVAGDDGARFRFAAGITIQKIGNTLRFLLPPGSIEATLYDMIGRELYHTEFPQQSGRPGFFWDGRTRNGRTVAAGQYGLVWSSESRRNAHRFFFVK
ncbi:MAG: hypothetical protein JXA18_16600 [Chitinispirillaceae bacterium]|nr:hypothetical protein [Chitinispirillaceae bacterium]